MVDVEIHRLQVGTGAEGDATRTGEDEHPGLRIGLELAQAYAKPLTRGGIDRVAAIGAVDREDRSGTDPFVAKPDAHSGHPCIDTRVCGFCRE
jgi:hypothetical protein